MLKVTTDRTPYYAGKPNAQIVKMCMEQVGAKPEEVLVVGDRLYTDIACGINAGVETALVYTGEAKPEDLVATELCRIMHLKISESCIRHFGKAGKR